MRPRYSEALPEYSKCWHEEAQILHGAAIQMGTNSNQLFNNLHWQQPGADADEFVSYVTLAAGNYKFKVLGAKSADAPKVDWYLGGVQIVSAQDWYSIATQYNTVITTTSVSVSVGGTYQLRGVVNGKNGGSSGFTLRLVGYWLDKV